METPNAQPPTKQLEIADALQEKWYFKPTPEIPKLTDRMMRGQPRLRKVKTKMTPQKGSKSKYTDGQHIGEIRHGRERNGEREGARQATCVY